MNKTQLLAPLFYLLMLSHLTGCADTNFLDKNQINQSILMGQEVLDNSPLAGRTVLIVQNYEYSKNKIQYFGLCSGIILNEQTILTAAHCVNNFKNSRVIVTSNIYTDKIPKQNVYKIKKVSIHEKYQNAQLSVAQKLNYDIAIIKLDRPLDNPQFNAHYLFMNSTKEYLENSTAHDLRPTILGFGKNRLSLDSSLKPINGYLQQAHIEIESFQYEKLQIRIEQKKKSGICSGDSGGPLFVMRNKSLYLQGLAVAVTKSEENISSSQLQSCDGQGIFLNLDFFKKWIYQNMN